MQTRIANRYRDTVPGMEAEDILRACVHCGFCNATCPTYRLTGDELDGPRGRIYQVKQLLEGGEAAASIQLHLDRCLVCRGCESTCPSGVGYHRLLDTGRMIVSGQVKRPLLQRLARRAIMQLAERRNAGLLFAAGRAVSRLLPGRLRKTVRGAPGHAIPGGSGHRRRMLLLDGCVQPAAEPRINAAAIHVFDRLGIELVVTGQAGCCGALQHHLDDFEGALQRARNNIDAWWPAVEGGAEAIVVTASGCGPMVRDYGRLLAGSPDYAEKAARIAALARDPGEVLGDTDFAPLGLDAAGNGQRIAFHSPCTLQHGQQLPGVVEDVLLRLGFELVPVADAHLCCGSAGGWSILHPGLSGRLKADKLRELQRARPERIATANIGCLLHLRADAAVPVVHWLELASELLAAQQ